jgi:hypothetical protein
MLPKVKNKAQTYILEPRGQEKSSRFYLELSGQAEYYFIYNYLTNFFSLILPFFYFVHTYKYTYLLEPRGQGKSSRFYLELRDQTKYVCSAPNLYFEIKKKNPSIKKYRFYKLFII